MLKDTDVSRAVSQALRHEPWLYELELDEEGWVPVDQLLEGLRDRGGDWESLGRHDLERMIANSTKRRHELDGDRIRALYGHSLPGRVHKCSRIPPSSLFHGTAPQSWAEIQTNGLLPMGRQFVHLSVDREMAMSVGHRKSPSPVLLVIDADGAAQSGVEFYEGNEAVWLADRIPARFIGVVD